MKVSLVLIVLFLTANSFSQEGERFEPGVKLIENERIADYKKPKSVLFYFEGHTHTINYFLDLKKRIEREFKNNMKDVNLGFNYYLSSKNPLESDLNNIPDSKYRKSEYETICRVWVSDFKNWDNHLFEERKQNYHLNIEFESIKSKKLFTSVLNVNTYRTIVTQNKKSSKLIYKIIME